MNTTTLEWTAVAFSLLGVWLMIQRRMLAWPVGLVSVALYALVFAQVKLYSDALLQVAFGGFLLYGWVNWRHQDKTDGRVHVAPLAAGTCIRDLGIGTAFGVLLGAAMHHYTDAALPWMDAMLAALSLVAQWWQARRHAATWWLWIAVNTVYIGMYFAKSLHVTAALYVVFIALAVMGLRAWRGSPSTPPQG